MKEYLGSHCLSPYEYNMNYLYTCGCYDIKIKYGMDFDSLCKVNMFNSLCKGCTHFRF